MTELLTVLGLTAALPCLLVVERLLTAENDASGPHAIPAWRRLGSRWRDEFVRLYRPSGAGWLLPFSSVLLVVTAVLPFAVIPLWATTSGGGNAGFAAGLLLIPAAMIAGAPVIAVCEGGWSARSLRWPMHGTAVGLAALGAVLLSGSLQLETIALVQQRQGMWWLARQPLGLTALVLCLVAQAAALRTPKDHPPEQAGTRGATPTDAAVFAEHLHLVATVYLLVLAFLGGGHVWGVTGGSESPAGWDAFFETTVLHLKAAAVLAWLMWLRCARLRDSGERRSWERAWMLALPIGLLNLAVTVVGETVAGGEAVVLKAAVSWGLLIAGLLTAGLLWKGTEAA